MLLENKAAVIYGAAGADGGAVSRAFAREGAQVFLAGRRPRDSTRWRAKSALRRGRGDSTSRCVGRTGRRRARRRGGGTGQALEASRRNLASELGEHGIRVLALQTAGVIDSIPEGFDGRRRSFKRLRGGRS